MTNNHEHPKTAAVQIPVKFDELIKAIETQVTDPIDRVKQAAMVASHIDAMADQVLGHFVDQARNTGATWSQIGTAIGVSKQAVQKRFVAKPEADMTNAGFEKFTENARAAIVAAQENARELGNVLISPAHLMLGVLVQPTSLACQALTTVGADLNKLRQLLLVKLPKGGGEIPAMIPFDDAAKKVLQNTFRQAIDLGCNYVGTEHILLTLLNNDAETGGLPALQKTIDAKAVAAHIEKVIAEYRKVAQTREDAGAVKA